MNPAITIRVLGEAAHLALAAQILDAHDTGEQVFSPTPTDTAGDQEQLRGDGPGIISPPGPVAPGGTVIDHVDLASVLIDPIAWDDALLIC